MRDPHPGLPDLDFDLTTHKLNSCRGPSSRSHRVCVVVLLPPQSLEQSRVEKRRYVGSRRTSKSHLKTVVLIKQTVCLLLADSPAPLIDLQVSSCDQRNLLIKHFNVLSVLDATYQTLLNTFSVFASVTIVSCSFTEGVCLGKQGSTLRSVRLS